MFSHMRDFVSFNDTFRDQETLTLKITDAKTSKGLRVEPGHYALFDFYSTDPKTREVFFNFFHIETQEILATIWCSLAPRALKAEAGLSPVHLQSPVAALLLKMLTEDQLTDKSFIRLLKARAKKMQDFGRSAEAFVTDPEMEKFMMGFLETVMEGRSGALHDNLLAFPVSSESVAFLDPLKMLEIEVHLQYTDVKRLIQVPAHLNLEDLHEILQVALGWENYHMWQFVDRSGKYFIADDDEPMFDETQTRYASQTSIANVLKRKGSKLLYTYDFGDNWEHLITVKRRFTATSKKEAVVKCLSGELAAPPEDCGSTPGYLDIIEALEEPNKMPEELKEWLGDYDPHAFDLKKINQKLKKIKK